MTTVFVAGSIKIKRLDPRFVDRIKNIVSDRLAVIVGDATGADTSIQTELTKLAAENVTVYCSGYEPRNNVGNWKVKPIHSSEEPGTRAYFTAKDKAMAADADFGLMLWDAASAGTLNNVLELVGGGKKCVVFINKEKTFLNIKEPKDLSSLVAFMSSGARTQAEKKIGLSKRLSQLENPQLGLKL
ncbi:hypothetical protein RSWS8N_15224 [Cereibacter sphaeroides WS8N]|uniref:hypothetical protein n=1 Tax=Cereibacter sphaeroides TaxID=1063 RepID=UPI00020B004B|nr:hypothetical protein [Cereibacter sphaeroides]EGJ19523.1 hypothetical protein RSWS8N_15224 [Cereibacter sphaeroides WS8N]